MQVQMRDISTETGLSLGRMKSILEAEIAELIGGVDMRQLVKDKLFATPRNDATTAVVDDVTDVNVADERPSERAMRLSRPVFDERMKEVRQEQRDPRAAGRTPPNHSILKGK